mmetsp:Transcript_52823/g.123163  ORF Transcript_52823/g.123163 Transcript_52823/m.123163 type:complete len:222 (-) Transcript_52823:245-910(-)
MVVYLDKAGGDHTNVGKDVGDVTQHCQKKENQRKTSAILPLIKQAAPVVFSKVDDEQHSNKRNEHLQRLQCVHGCVLAHSQRFPNHPRKNVPGRSGPSPLQRDLSASLNEALCTPFRQPLGSSFYQPLRTSFRKALNASLREPFCAALDKTLGSSSCQSFHTTLGEPLTHSLPHAFADPCCHPLHHPLCGAEGRLLHPPVFQLVSRCVELIAILAVAGLCL